MGRKLLVVLGAGATHDAVRWNLSQAAPPLTVQLFDAQYSNVLARHAPAAPIIGELRLAVENNEPVEAAIDEMWNDGENDPRVAGRILALQWYLQDLLTVTTAGLVGSQGQVNNYALLCDRIETWRARTDSKVGYVTFNCDTLLEDALPHIRLDSVDAYVSHQHTKIFKVHGSTNWVREIPPVAGEPGRYVGDFRYQRVFPRAADLVPRATGQYCRIPAPDRPEANGHLSVPVIAIPTVSRSAFAFPDGHLAVMREVLPGVTHLLSIGWKGEEPHFLKELTSVGDNLVHADFVSRRRESAVRTAEVMSKSFALDSRFHGGGFSQYVGAKRLLADLLAED